VSEGVRQLYHRLLGREPAADELGLAKRYVSSSGKPLETGSWGELAQALLLSNEFLFVD